jgi:hypothetical protein
MNFFAMDAWPIARESPIGSGLWATEQTFLSLRELPAAGTTAGSRFTSDGESGFDETVS